MHYSAILSKKNTLELSVAFKRPIFDASAKEDN